MALLLALGWPAAVAAEDDGLGRTPTPAEIAAWDIDVRPDGLGLPTGNGTATEGEEIYLERCAHCHGEFGEGAGRYPVLMGGAGSLESDDPVKTIGSYWPYTSTLFDYINRAMPFGDAQSLSPDEVYAVTAYVLFLNDLIEDDQPLNQDNLALVELPNQSGFVDDTRPDTVSGEPCMKACKDAAEVAFKAKPLDVTPDKEANTD